MANFSTIYDVRNALTPGAVADDKATAAGFGDEQIQDALNQADAKMLGYLPGHYGIPRESITQNTVPVSVAVAPFRYWSRDIAAYLTSLTFYRNKNMVADEAIRLRYEQTMSDLLAVQAGSFLLPKGDPTTTTVQDSLSVFNQYDGTMFWAEDFDLSRLSPADMLYWDARTRGLL